MVNFRITWTLYTGAVGNSAYQMGDWTAQLETAPTGGRKCLFIFSIYYKIATGVRCHKMSHILTYFAYFRKSSGRTLMGISFDFD